MPKPEERVAKALTAIEAAGGLVTPHELASEWGISEQAIAERIARGTFPEPAKLAGRVRLYLRDQVDGYRRDRSYSVGDSVPITGRYALVDARGTSGGVLVHYERGSEFEQPRRGYRWVLARAGRRPELFGPAEPRTSVTKRRRHR